MLSVFTQNRQLFTIKTDTLPSNFEDLQRHILSLAGSGYKFVRVHDLVGIPVNGQSFSTDCLSYAVVGQTEAQLVSGQPIKITIRKTDKMGYIFFKHKSTTVGQLKGDIQKAMGVSVDAQQLVHRGQIVGDSNQTIQSLDFAQSSILHLVDLSKKAQDPLANFHLFIQVAQRHAQINQISAWGAMEVGELKVHISQLYEIPPENVLLTYCGRILQKNQSTLLEYDVVPDSFINVIKEVPITPAVLINNPIKVLAKTATNSNQNSPKSPGQSTDRGTQNATPSDYLRRADTVSTNNSEGSPKEGRITAGTSGPISFGITTKAAEVRRIESRPFGQNNI